MDDMHVSDEEVREIARMWAEIDAIDGDFDASLAASAARRSDVIKHTREAFDLIFLATYRERRDELLAMSHEERMNAIIC